MVEQLVAKIRRFAAGVHQGRERQLFVLDLFLGHFLCQRHSVSIFKCVGAATPDVFSVCKAVEIGLLVDVFFGFSQEVRGAELHIGNLDAFRYAVT